MDVIGIIPARFASTRFPGKPLADIQGKSMIQRVYEQAVKADTLNHVLVATDDERIYEEVERFGGKAIMTSPTHPSGTDRCHEAVSTLESKGKRVDVVVNIQGDEPFIHPGQINLVASCFTDPEVNIATLIKKIGTNEELFNPSVNKVIVDRFMNALYFSRHPIPFHQHLDKEAWIDQHTYYKHIGIYGYRVDVLRRISNLPPSNLEKAESLEQLRWLENGYKIRTIETNFESQSVDEPGDLSKFTNMT
jgi:3-deoxy-manno-octulosonate cytidylyltransferase (CMP-KDO synthetase)